MMKANLPPFDKVYCRDDSLESYGAVSDSSSPIDTQIGGDHYKKLKIQPFEYTYANYGYIGLKAAVHTKVNKYILRDKGTEIEDIEKAIHVLQILLQAAKEGL